MTNGIVTSYSSFYFETFQEIEDDFTELAFLSIPLYFGTGFLGDLGACDPFFGHFVKIDSKSGKAFSLMYRMIFTLMRVLPSLVSLVLWSGRWRIIGILSIS